MRKFVNTVWKILRTLDTGGALCSIEPVSRSIHESDIKDYVVGKHARQLATEGMLLKHCASPVYYTVAPAQPADQ